MSFFNELRRRNVLRVGAAYIVTAWLVIQVVETIFPAFGFGDVAVRYVTIAFTVGLVPALVVAWVFELRPEGLKKDAEVDHDRAFGTVRSARAIGIETCPDCGGKLRVIACIEDPMLIRKILRHVQPFQFPEKALYPIYTPTSCRPCIRNSDCQCHR